jgi:hypothetical protein
MREYGEGRKRNPMIPKVPEKKVPRKMVTSKREAVTGGWENFSLLYYYYYYYYY